MPSTLNPYDVAKHAKRLLRRYLIATWPLLFRRKIIKLAGAGGIETKVYFYPSFFHFKYNLPSRRHYKNYDCLIQQNFLHKDFISCQKPKIFFTCEPLPEMTTETREHLQWDSLKPYLFLYSEPDIKKRMFYPAFQSPHADRGASIKQLEDTLLAKRTKLCCIVNRYRETRGPDLLGERVKFVEAMGKDIDIYGRDTKDVPNTWKTFPNYRGPVQNKIETLRYYNFTIAFENTDEDGYITEKIFDAFLGGAIPLYWGGGKYLKETIPSDCYINCRNQDPCEIHQMIRNMSEKDIVPYRRAAVRFLKSESARLFTRKYWAERVILRLLSHPGHPI